MGVKRPSIVVPPGEPTFGPEAPLGAAPFRENADGSVVGGPSARSAVEQFREWYAMPTHKPKEYWDDLLREIESNRFSLTRKGD